jgi:hypothetical protein
MTRPPRPLGTGRPRLLWWSSIAAALFLAVVVVLVAVSGPRETLEVLREVPGRWLAAPLAVLALHRAHLATSTDAAVVPTREVGV